MPDNNDMTFTFDTSFFENAINKINKKLSTIGDSANNVTQKIMNVFGKVENRTKGFSDMVKGSFQKVKNTIIAPFNFIKDKIGGVFKKTKDGAGNMGAKVGDISKGVVKGMTGMILKVGLFGLALKGIRGILNNMPEIGQAFGIAKDIFMKNLLFPLRKMIFPYLQKILDWVRDNRTQFVRWGGIVANVFRIVAQFVKNAVSIAKTLIGAFKGFFEKLFGSPIKSIEETFNVLSFKLAVISTFITGLFSKLVDGLEPTFTTIGEIIATVIDAFGKFFDGFSKGFGDVDKKFPIFENLNNMFRSLLNLIKELTPLFEPLGELVGKVFGTTLIVAFRTIEGVLNTIVDLIKWIKGELTGKELLSNMKGYGLNILDVFKTGEGEKVEDAIIKPNGEIIRTSPDDTIVATKSRLSMGGDNKTNVNSGVNISSLNIDFTGMKIVLPNATTEEAQKVGMNIVSTIRNQLSHELNYIGG